MTHLRSLIALAVVTAFTSAVSAQPMPAQRSDVKADAKAAVKANATDQGELTNKKAGRVGEASSGMSSDKSRSDVKNEAKAAVKAGTTAEGEKGGTSYSGPAAKTGSTASRMDVKAEAKAANKANTTAEGEKGGPNYSSEQPKGAK